MRGTRRPPTSWRLWYVVWIACSRNASSGALALTPSRPPPAWPVASGRPSRRQWLWTSATTACVLGAAATSLATPAYATDFATAAGRKDCVTTSDPSKTIVSCRGNLLDALVPTATTTPGAVATAPPNYGPAARLSGISATENGVGTSAVKNPSRYSPPWSYLPQTSDPAVAWKSLRQAVESSLHGVQVVTATDTYLHVTVPTVRPPLPGVPPAASVDDLEFLLRPADAVVLYRSASRTSVFVYPLTQPVSDGQANLQRLEGLRQTLGWSRLGGVSE
jgi:uncharacterized protein (DUF1499 family)